MTQELAEFFSRLSRCVRSPYDQNCAEIVESSIPPNTVAEASVSPLAKSSVGSELATFFETYRSSIASPVRASVQSFSTMQMEPGQLQAFFKSIQEPIEIARESGMFFDPWAVVGLGRKEVRNSAVLSWILDPHGSHGMGSVAVNALLMRIPSTYFDLDKTKSPVETLKSCKVTAEHTNFGVAASSVEKTTKRFDIKIDSEDYYLVIEVKIDAPEGKDQMKLYAGMCQDAAKKRPWAMIFLTPSGMESKTSGEEFSHKVFPLSWSEIAFVLETPVREHFQKFQRTKGPDRHMLEQTIFRYFQHMKHNLTRSKT